MATKEEMKWIMSDFGWNDYGRTDDETKQIINESVQKFLNDKKNYTGWYIKYLKDIGQFNEEDEEQYEKLNIIRRINLLLDKESKYKLLKIERIIAQALI